MSLRTGENEMGLKKVIDMTRLIAIVLLLLHFYYFCYGAFQSWGLTASLSDQVLKNISRTGLFDTFFRSKGLALAMLLISLLGVKGRKSEKLNYRTALAYLVTGLFLYLISGIFLLVETLNPEIIALLYMGITGIGFILIITGGGLLTRIIKQRLKPDVFNRANETFPQEERLLENEYSINLPAVYTLKGKQRKSWVNIIAPARGVLCLGSPGSGKSRFFVEPAIRQLLAKGHTMVLYDFKYPDLSQIAYHHFRKNQQLFPVPPTFYVINFDDLSHSHRCNPLDPENMHDITDAVEAARTLMTGLNKSWQKKQGEFFVESPINFVVALIWFLRKYQDGRYCTLPHVIELMQVETEKLFTILQTELEILAYIRPFINAYKEGALEQLEGQLDSAKIGIARLSSPTLYYVLSGNDFRLDVNNPKSPKILCLANNPQKQDVYGPVLSLYLTRISKIINRKNQQKCAVVIDEFATVTFMGLDNQIATGRSNLITTILALQSDSQLRLHYGKEWADVVLNICGNIIVGQSSGDFAKSLSERLGKTLQDRENISINSADTSVSRSKQLELTIPVSTLAALSSGEMVGIVADSPSQPIQLKAFHATLVVDEQVLAEEKDTTDVIPVVRNVTKLEVMNTYILIKQDVEDLVEQVLEQILNDPSREHLVVRKS